MYPPERRRIPDQQAPGVERRVEPLVRVERERIGAREGRHGAADMWRLRGERAVGAVNVEPQSGLGADVGDGAERIDRAGVDVARSGDDADRVKAGGAIGGDL